MEGLKRLEIKEGGDWVLLVRCNTVGRRNVTELEHASPSNSRSTKSRSTSASSIASINHNTSADNTFESESRSLGRENNVILDREEAFANTYFLLGPLLQFVQDPRSGATCCFIGSTRMTSGNYSTHIPVKAPTSPASLCGQTESSSVLPCPSGEVTRPASLTLQLPAPSASQFVRNATRDGVTQTKTDAARSGPDVHVNTDAFRKDDPAVGKTPKGTFTRDTAPAGAPSARIASELVSERGRRADAAGAAIRKTSTAGVVRVDRGSMSADGEVASAGAADRNTACSISDDTDGCGKQAARQPMVVEGEESVVTAIEYEAYEPMALQQLRAACRRARAAFPSIVKIAVMHLLGVCKLGQPGLIIFVTAPHRQECQGASALLVDLIKRHVPIWKVEHFSSPEAMKSYNDRSCENCINDSNADHSSSSSEASCSSSKHAGSEMEIGERACVSASLHHGGLSVKPKVQETPSPADAACSAVAIAHTAVSAAAEFIRKNSSITSRRSGEDADANEAHMWSSARSHDASLTGVNIHFRQAVAQGSRGGNTACRTHPCSLSHTAHPCESCKTETSQCKTLSRAAAGDELPFTTYKTRRVQGQVIPYSLPLLSLSSTEA